MIQIEMPSKLPPEIVTWKVEAQRITDLILAENDLAAKHELIDKFSDHWRNEALIKWLSDLSNDKCWYTETKFGGDYQELEHFRPKGQTKNSDGKPHATHPGYYWLAFELDNYRLSKSRPNRKKSSLFPIIDERNRAECADHDWRDELPLFLDPVDEEDCMLLTFNDDGSPVAMQNIEKQDEDRVSFTIDKLHLNERVLNKRRAEVWTAARDLYSKYSNQMKQAKANPRDKVSIRAKAKKDLVKLKKMLKCNEEFSSVARASLIKTDERMAIIIVASS